MSVLTLDHHFSFIRVTTVQVPRTDQETGIVGTEPTETLQRFRSDKVLLPHKKPQGQVCESVLYAMLIYLLI